MVSEVSISGSVGSDTIWKLFLQMWVWRNTKRCKNTESGVLKYLFRIPSDLYLYFMKTLR